MRNMDWMDDMACKDVDPDVFFPTDVGMAGQWAVANARMICETCPVQIECAEHKKQTGATQGVWAGKASGSKNVGRSSGGPQGVAPHGTDRRYRQHQRDGEQPCAACWAAHSAKGAPGGRSRVRRWA